jgi:hypothetical protein
MKLVSDNEEAVEPSPSWDVVLEAGQGNFAQHFVTGYPSFSGPLLTFFSSEEEDGKPVFLTPYHRVIHCLPYISTGAQLAS